MTPAMKPDDIPEDIWRNAGVHFDMLYDADTTIEGGSEHGICAAIAYAVLEERARCAKIAEGFEQTRDWVPGSLYDTLRREVAAAIRQER